MKSSRQAEIRKLIEKNGRATVIELSSLLIASPATIRRDLEELGDQGFVQRVHGGAILLEHNTKEPPVMHRVSVQSEEKQRIGRVAASLVMEGDTIFLGSGSTVYEVAKNLFTCRNLTIITNSYPVIGALHDAPNVTIVCTGGLLRQGELSMIGHICEHTLQDLRADKVIMGIHALDLENGLSSGHLSEILTDRSILRLAPKVILVADHTKLSKVSSIIVGPITSIHTLVTDRSADLDFIEKFRSLGIKVLLA
jgi:DeoR/GlpR family transcriptional regulator of sugar metabolism